MGSVPGDSNAEPLKIRALHYCCFSKFHNQGWGSGNSANEGIYPILSLLLIL